MKKIFKFVMLAALLLLSSCSKDTKESKSDYTAFLGLLTENEFQYAEENSDSDSFLSVERKPISIGEEIISIYEYNSTQEMEKDSAYIDKDGYGISRPGKEVKIDWISSPHFFKKDTLIINYVGEDELILKLLTEIMGLNLPVPDMRLYNTSVICSIVYMRNCFLKVRIAKSR